MIQPGRGRRGGAPLAVQRRSSSKPSGTAGHNHAPPLAPLSSQITKAPTLIASQNRQAARYGVRRLAFAHIGRPTIAALDAGQGPPFGEIGVEGGRYPASRRSGRTIR